MTNVFRFIPAIILLVFISCSRKMASQGPSRPALEKTDFKLDSLPDSEINIPIRVSLHPFYEMAEKKIDTAYTSPNYPGDWVQADCGTRYKYHFRRGPLQMRVAGTVMSLAFTGYYQIAGSTRVCVNGAVISPWTPPCYCGFKEPERRVTVSFSNSVAVLPDYKLKLSVKRLEPRALDKCNVCFWGQDITNLILEGLKQQLDISRAEMEASYGTVDLRAKFQQLWGRLSQSYKVYGMGWLQINPKKIRLNNLIARNDTLHLDLGISAHPVIALEKQQEHPMPLPDMTETGKNPGFNIFLDALLNYDSLGNLVNANLQGKKFDFKKGPVNKFVVVKNCTLLGVDNERLVIKLDFTGSYNGLAYFTGKPYYDEQSKVLEMRDIDFDVKTKDALLKTAGWLFNKRIGAEIKKYCRFDLTTYIDSAKAMINQQLTKHWVDGIKSYGQINEIKLIGIYPVARHLVIRSNCSGELAILVESINLGF